VIGAPARYILAIVILAVVVALAVAAKLEIGPIVKLCIAAGCSCGWPLALSPHRRTGLRLVLDQLKGPGEVIVASFPGALSVLLSAARAIAWRPALAPSPSG